jgi:hypothetical protein
MSSKKRKGDLPANAAAETVQKASRNVAQSLQAMPGIDDAGGGDEAELATMRMKFDESQAKLAAALLDIERLKIGNARLEAAASEPCARCHFYSDWTVRVRTMSGQVHTIACPDGPKTLVAHVKQKLAYHDPKCHIVQQVRLVLPCEVSIRSSSSADASDPALADDRTLASYGVSKHGLLDLLLVDINWSNQCQEMIVMIKDGGEATDFTDVNDDDSVLAVSWALVNAVPYVCYWRYLNHRSSSLPLNVLYALSNLNLSCLFTRAFVFFAQINPALSSLKFSDESISAGGASKICSALHALSIAQGLQVGARISTLQFSGNNIGDAGANSCADLLRVSAWLKELFLFRCGISSVGAASLGSALRFNASHQLETLSLARNAIGSDGVKAIGAALCVNTSLQKLYMGGCQIGSGGVQELAEALKVNGSLR